METIRFSRIGKQDLALEPRNGNFEVTLADGRVVTLDNLDVAYLLSDAYPQSTIPSHLPIGQVFRQTDGIRGLWGINQAEFAFHLTGEIISLAEFGFAPSRTGVQNVAALQAAVDAAPDGSTFITPPGIHRIGSPGLRVDNRNNLRFTGSGWGSIWQRDPTYGPANAPLAVFGNTTSCPGIQPTIRRTATDSCWAS